MQLNHRLTERGRPGGLTIWTVALSMAALYAVNGFAQAVPKAAYVPEGSFQLPGRGQPGSPDDPIALALGHDRTIHIVDHQGLVIQMVEDPAEGPFGGEGSFLSVPVF